MKLIVHTVIKPLLVGTLLTLVPLAAQGHRPDPRPHHDGGPGFGLQNLTEAQNTSLKAIADKHKAAMESKHKAEGEAQEAFQKAMRDPATKEADLKALFDKASQARFAALLEHRAMMQESQAILTAEQKAELQKRQAGGPEGKPEHRGAGPGEFGPHHRGPGAEHDGHGPDIGGVREP